MKKLSKPLASAKSAYLVCIGSVVHINLKRRLESATDAVVRASDEFDAAAKSQQVHTIPTQDLNGLQCSKSDLINVYEERMRRKGSPGRLIYDSLLNSPPNRRCPLCSHRDVSTIDHYLDKSSYPLLSVAPLNLIPSCKDCNYIKLSFNPNVAEEVIMHPYYDDVNDGTWLYSKLIEKTPIGIRFFFRDPGNWNQVKSRRVRNHFNLFDLATLYNANAANELLNIKYQYSKLLEKSGSTILAESLRSAKESREHISLNSWQAAMYRELATNDWYLSGGAFD